ncbi:MAG: FecR domain-containing protein [Spirochaetales bacterium]|nr:FecR domain-containing protein [Spirochaetales bacterium]
MKKHILVILIIFMGTFLFADITAVVKDISGKVEIQVPGGRWKKATEGMKIEEGYMISTGFRSEAVLELGSSQVIVKQLTRMELTELVEKEGTVRTGLNLRVGKIKAEVRTTAGLRQEFRLTSPVSTAAVRGTSFEYDGINLKVLEGSVEFTNRRGQKRLVPAGVASRIIGTSLPQSGEELKNLLISIDPSTLTIPEEFDIPGFMDFLDGFDGITDVTITINWG